MWFPTDYSNCVSFLRYPSFTSLQVRSFLQSNDVPLLLFLFHVAGHSSIIIQVFLNQGTNQCVLLCEDIDFMMSSLFTESNRNSNSNLVAYISPFFPLYEEVWVSGGFLLGPRGSGKTRNGDHFSIISHLLLLLTRSDPIPLHNMVQFYLITYVVLKGKI